MSVYICTFLCKKDKLNIRDFIRDIIKDINRDFSIIVLKYGWIFFQ